MQTANADQVIIRDVAPEDDRIRWFSSSGCVVHGPEVVQVIVDGMLMQRSLEGIDVAYVYLDAIVLKVRSAGKVVGLPVLVAVAVLTDGEKQVLSNRMRLAA